MSAGQTLCFVDLAAQQAALRPEIDGALARVLDRSRYVLGQELEAFEAEFAAYCGVGHCVGVGNGTDALTLALMACGVGEGDEVITVSHTFFATAAAISATGAKPVFVDVDPDTALMDAECVRDAITVRTRAIVPVHLYGRCVPMEAILELARERNIRVVEDAAQAHGAVYRGGRAGSLGHIGCFSFYPSKNLGALGDGGAVTTDDADLAERVVRLRNYGQSDKHVHPSVGQNSRLDELQAAVLRIKLPRLDAWNGRRRALAGLYGELLADSALGLCARLDPCGSVHHLYAVTSKRRDELRTHLWSRGIETQIHYPRPIHLQPPYRDMAPVEGSLAVSEHLASQVLSLPIHPALADADVRRVCRAALELDEG